MLERLRHRRFFGGLLICAVVLACATPTRAEQRAETPYGGVRVVAFDRRETRRIFDVAGTAVVAFDGYAPDTQVVFVLTTRRGPCVDSGQLDVSGALPMIRLDGKCSKVTGILLDR
ncbi:MAG TPA: hypothetical protein VGR62_09635 [Candidatus Binatia bacterium]|jgi:hypothetical protein|nr:hypothetical protein [Candidatus Binatia bacterium]